MKRIKQIISAPEGLVKIWKYDDGFSVQPVVVFALIENTDGFDELTQEIKPLSVADLIYPLSDDGPEFCDTFSVTDDFTIKALAAIEAEKKELK